MQVTVIRQGYEVKQILFGEPTEQIKEWVNQLNANPLIDSEWTYSNEYIKKSIWDLKEFLNIQ